MAKGFERIGGMSEKDSLLMQMTLVGGPQVGYITNPETRTHQGFIEKNGEKIVCLAQGGECRYNPNFKVWKTPIIQEDCPNECCYKSLVCDEHPRDCKGSTTYNPQYNKFRGQFGRYCRNFDRLKKTQKEKKSSELK